MIFFELFAADQVLRHMRFSPPSIESGLVGEGNDGGIDGIYLFVNGRMVSGDVKPEDLEHYKKNVVIDWVLIQATREHSFKEDVLPKIQQTVTDALDYSLDAKALKKSYNSDVVEAITRFRLTRRYLQAAGASININIFHACKGDSASIHPKVGIVQKERLENHIVASIPGNTTCDVHSMGARELADLASKAPQTKRALVYANLLLVTGGGFVSLVTLDNYDNFISEDGKLLRYLFESNVRDYLEDVDVNNDIRDSLNNPTGEDFWLLNNGITILADSVVPDSERLLIDDPQIVNGLQTSEEIYNYCRSSPNPSHLKRRVMVRVITSTSTDGQDRIIKATNRQTGITAAQLHATEQVHRDIEKVFPASGLLYDRRRKYWQYKDKPRDQLVGIQELSQSLVAIYLQRPDTSRGRPGDVFSKKNKEIYESLYSPKTTLSFYVNCAKMQKAAEAYLRMRGLPRGTANDLRFYLSMYAAMLALESRRPTIEVLAGFERDISSTTLDEAYGPVWECYSICGRDEDAAKGSLMLQYLLEWSEEDK